MAKRQATITAYNKAVAQIQNGLTNDADPVVANLGAIEIPLDELNPIVKDHELSFAGIERKNFIQQFDDSLVTTGTNTIIIDAGAVILHEVDSTTGVITERTGWANSGSIDVTGIASGVIWAVYPGLTYSATDDNPANKPANAYRLLTFTNSGGTVTVNTKTWQNCIESQPLRFEEEVIFNGGLDIKNGTSNNLPLPTNYHDVRIEYTSASTITVLAGSRVRSSDDTTDIIFSSNATCVLSSSGAGGLDTGAEASNTWYYLYAIYNPTTDTNALLFSVTNESITGSVTLPSGYTKKRQLRYKLFNNASSNIESISSLEGYSERILISEQIVTSAVANIDFININSCQSYEIEVDSITPATNGGALRIRVSTDNGSSYKAGASDYYNQEFIVFGALQASGAGAGSSITITQGLSNAEVSSGIIKILNLRASNKKAIFINRFHVIQSTPRHEADFHSGRREAAEDNNAIRLFFHTGNIASGTFRLYGLR